MGKITDRQMTTADFQILIDELFETGNLRPRLGYDLTFEQLGKLAYVVWLRGNRQAKENFGDWAKYSTENFK